MKRIFALALILALCLTACGTAVKGEKEEYQLYFLSREDSGGALVPVPYQEREEPTPRQLLTALLAGPEDQETAAPFPAGVFLRSCRLEEGVLYVDLSEDYGGLSDVRLTLADYAITMTLCQLEQVDGVCITAAGQPLSYRSHQILTPEEAVLSGTVTEAEPEEETN